ncbi:IclR family transcriptional regulator [Ureibacillus composti]
MSSNYRVPAVEKIYSVLEIIAESSEALTLAQIIKLSGLNKSTVYSLLLSLTDVGLLKKNDDNTFELGYKIGYLGARYVQKSDLVNEFKLLASEAVKELSQTFQLSVLQQKNIVYLSKVEAKNTIQLSTNPGSILPAHSTAMGKVLLSSLSESELETLYEGYEFEKLTADTVDNLEDLKNQLAFAQKHSYFQEVGEVSEELTCIAAPIYGLEHKIVAAISISLAVSKFNLDAENYIQGVKELAKNISHRLGYWPKD